MTDDTPVFVSDGQFELAKYGTIYTGPCPADWRDRSKMVKAVVMFNGRKRTVKGVECFATMQGPYIGTPIGILFEDEVPE